LNQKRRHFCRQGSNMHANMPIYNYSKQSLSFFYLGMFFLNLSSKNRNFYSEFPCIFPQLIYQQKKAKCVSQKRRLRLLPTDPHNIHSFCA
jgi:hypothetical protein